MDIESLKKRIAELKKEQADIDASIRTAGREIQDIVNQHNERNNKLVADRNRLEGKIDMLKEFVALGTSSKKEKKKDEPK